MSKIGNYNLEVEEELSDQLNELGFESLQDALNSGYAIGVTPDENASLTLVKDADFSDLAYKQAQKDWEKEKEKVLESLDDVLRGVTMPLEWSSKLVDAIEFIKKARF